ncbi:unnamed protein product [Fusarium venenatum]|uniref:Uncharacterized protein n=1 Tax=Fusarium venenatum TaxID=56646 RepID=A0A2L2TKH4_9HYPO|nr:uncharacterized protein FVRRES_08680 [Fusarium venenatum]KAH6965435.1 hypothetical protein EDB82DRAFT_529159 [Fusarium venenatum]CEI68603.1 unnamed protein product [Fusarium venenatum]
MPKAKGERSVSARKNPIAGRSSRRLQKSSDAAPKKTNNKKSVKEERVHESESDDEETAHDSEDDQSTAGDAPSDESVNDSADGEGNALVPALENMALTMPQQPAPPGWTYQLVPITYQGETAGQAAFRLFGKSLNIESALTKRLYDEQSLRPVQQRNRKTKLNMTRRSNAEALLAHITGVQVQQPCKNCSGGHGPWKECVIYDGEMCGSCTNYNNQTCFFLPAPFSMLQPEGMPALPMGVSPMLTGSSQYYLGYNNQQSLAQPSTALDRLQSIGAIASGISSNPMDRLIGRVESAAIELGNRIGEFQEFIQTPQGHLMMTQRTTQMATPALSSVEELASDHEN